MPTNTFFRLDEARREEISNSVMHLFVENLYEDMTVIKFPFPVFPFRPSLIVFYKS